MYSLISDYRFIQALKLRVCSALMFVGLTVAAQAAQSEENSAASDLDIWTVQPMRTDADPLLPYQFGASVALTRSPDAIPAGLGAISPSPSFPVTGLQPERVAQAYPQQANDGERVSLKRLLRVEVTVEQVSIAFRPQSVLFEREGLKVTFRPRSALIEGEQFKAMLQPHSASLLWCKAF